MKIISKFLIIILSISILIILYLSFFGIETKRFNSQISQKVKTINKNLEIDLKSIKISLDLFKFKIYAKTVGPKIKSKDKVLEIENIKTQISLNFLIKDEFSLENLEISTKSIEIKKLVSFLRSLKQTPELYIFEKLIKKGYLIADIKLEFDAEGKIKDNYSIKGINMCARRK